MCPVVFEIFAVVLLLVLGMVLISLAVPKLQRWLGRKVRRDVAEGRLDEMEASQDLKELASAGRAARGAAGDVGKLEKDAGDGVRTGRRAGEAIRRM